MNLQRAGAGLAAGIVMGITGFSATPAYAAPDQNCPDFNSQAKAQAYFRSNGGSKTNNVDGLDRDNDGVACENNTGYPNPARDLRPATGKQPAKSPTRAPSPTKKPGNGKPQVPVTPVGGVEAGSGDTTGIEAMPLLASGSALTGAGVLLFAFSRRRPRKDL